MKTKKLIDFYLPFPWNIHARILFVSIIGSLIFRAIFWQGEFFQPFITGILIMILDAEIIYWISRALFNSTKGQSPRDVTFQILWRVAVFLLMIMVVGTTVASGSILIMNMSNGNTLTESIHIVRQFELKGIITSLFIASLVATFAFFFMLWQEAMKSVFKAREQMLITKARH
jgi:hypothetical protein